MFIYREACVYPASAEHLPSAKCEDYMHSFARSPWSTYCVLGVKGIAGNKMDSVSALRHLAGQ